MRFPSIRGLSPPGSFEEALFRGIAPDGSLYVPGSLPRLHSSLLDRLATLSLPEVGEVVLAPFLDEIPLEDLREILCEAWTFPIPLVRLERGLFLLELFHGPTLAFKDVGARFMARALSSFLEKRARHVTIAVATSGDTGGAVAHGFHGMPHVDVFVLYPSGKISALQERQIATLGGNIHAIAVEGTFDDCQRLVQRALEDPEVQSGCALTTANSMNLGRLLPQLAYYAWAIAEWRRSGGSTVKAPIVVVPSGNFGNLTAGVYARRMGVAIGRLVAATNSNDIVPRYLESGVYAPRPPVQTWSTAMDVGRPNNLARLLHLCGEDVGCVRQEIEAAQVSDEETLVEMRRTFERTGRVLDPHTAVGVAIARRIAGERTNGPAVIALATAHPVKFPDAVERSLGQSVPLPPALQGALHAPIACARIGPAYDEWKSLLLSDRGNEASP